MDDEAFTKMDSLDQNSTPSSTPAVRKKKLGVKVKKATLELNELTKHLRYNCSEGKESLFDLAVRDDNISLLNEEIQRVKEMDDLNGLDHQGFAALHHSTRHNRINAIQILLKNGASVDVRTKDDLNTPLHVATRFGWPEATKILLDNGADPSAQNANGSTPLHLASRRSNSEVMALLLRQPSVDVNAKNKLQLTPLHIAASKGCPEVCTMLMDHGADVFAVASDQTTPLLSAIFNGDSKRRSNLVANVILSRAIESNQCLDNIVKSRDMDGNTILHLCAIMNSIGIAQRIIELGADVNDYNPKYGATPLHMACAMGSLEMAKMLVEMKAELKFKTFKGQTPLHKAAIFGHTHIIEYLLDNGADVDPCDNSNQTPFLAAVASSRTNTNAVQELLRRGAKIDAYDAYLKNCLHLAIENQNIEVLIFLLEYDSALENLYTSDVQERVPLHYAAMCENIKALKVLLTKQTRLNFQDEDHNTPMHLAAKHDRAEHVEVLGVAGASVNERDEEGKTALHAAASNGNRKVCKTLIKQGTCINSHDENRQTPLMCAALAGCAKTCKTLLENNASINDTNIDGETALLIAVRQNNGPVVEMLLDLDVDVNHRNLYGQGLFEVAVKWNALDAVKSICQHKRWREVLGDSSSRPMKILIQSFPEAAITIMNKCIKKPTNMNPKHQDYTIEYDFALLDPGPDDPDFLKGNRYFGPLTMVENNRQDLLLHPLTQALLDRKWRSFGSFIFNFSFLNYLIFLIFYSYFIISETEVSKLNFTTSNSTAKTSAVFEVTGWKYVLAVIILAFVIAQLVREIAQIILQRCSYFKDIVNLMEWVLYTSTSVFLAPYVAPDFIVDSMFESFTDPHSLWIIAVISIFLCYLNFVLFLRRFNVFGIYISMFVEVFRSVVRVMFVFFELIAAFAVAFFILFKEQPSFQTFGRSFMKTTMMTLGEMDFTSTFVDSIKENNQGVSANPYPEIGFFFCFIFAFAMSISLMNLLIGLAIGDIEAIRRNAELKRLARQVEFVAKIEESYPRWITRLVYQPKIEVTPNKKTFRNRFKGLHNFWSAAMQNFAPKQDTQQVEGTNYEDPISFGRKLEKNRRQIKELVAVIKTQNRILNAVANKIDPHIMSNFNPSLMSKTFGSSEELDGVDK